MKKLKSIYICIYGETEGMKEERKEVTEAETGRGKLQKEGNETEEGFLAWLFDPDFSFRLITAAPGREINGRNWPLKTSCLLL